MVRKHLTHRPVDVLEGTDTHPRGRRAGRAHGGAGEQYFQRDIHHKVVVPAQVVKHGWIAFFARRARNAVRAQGIKRDNPRAHRGAEILGSERPEWLVLPLLHVAR